jgi:cation transport protein ChaC
MAGTGNSAFDRGGSCRAGVQRLSAKTARDRLGQLLRRETTSKQHPTNRPRWGTVDAGGQRRQAIIFAVVRSSPYYSGDLSLEDTAEVLARAVGHWGSGAKYLLNTVLQLENLGIHDRNLWRLFWPNTGTVQLPWCRAKEAGMPFRPVAHPCCSRIN